MFLLTMMHFRLLLIQHQKPKKPGHRQPGQWKTCHPKKKKNRTYHVTKTRNQKFENWIIYLRKINQKWPKKALCIFDSSYSSDCCTEDYCCPTPVITPPQEAKYVERWPNTTSALAGWSRFDIPVYRYGGVHSLLHCTSITLVSPTCHQASQQENTY